MGALWHPPASEHVHGARWPYIRGVLLAWLRPHYNRLQQCIFRPQGDVDGHRQRGLAWRVADHRGGPGRFRPVTDPEPALNPRPKWQFVRLVALNGVVA